MTFKKINRGRLGLKVFSVLFIWQFVTGILKLPIMSYLGTITENEYDNLTEKVPIKLGYF